MGREASITYEQVATVANAYMAEGGKPTLRAIRQRLGSGSMSTIQMLLARWQSAHVQSFEPAKALPQSVHDTIFDFLVAEVARHRGMLETQLADAQQSVTDLVAEIERLEGVIETLEQGIDKDREARSQAEGKYLQIQPERDALKDEVERLRKALDKERHERHQAEIEMAKAQQALLGVNEHCAERQQFMKDLLDEKQKMMSDLEAAVRELEHRILVESVMKDGKSDTSTPPETSIL